MDNFPHFFRHQYPAKTEEDQTKMKNKLDKVRKMLYIEPGAVLSLSHIFYVYKGLNDIQMIYNCTSCCLNLALWSPHVGLPIVQHNLCTLLPVYSQCDMDVGEIFLNFPLHPNLRPFSGVDITHINNRSDEKVWYQDRTRVW